MSKVLSLTGKGAPAPQGPARSSARISATELSAGPWGAGAPLPVSDRTLDMVRGRVIRLSQYTGSARRPRAHQLTADRPRTGYGNGGLNSPAAPAAAPDSAPPGRLR